MTVADSVGLAETIARITPIVESLLIKRGVAKPIKAEEPLRAAGLTSLDVVNLVLAVEGEFDIFIPEDRITPEALHSLSALAKLVSPLLVLA